MNPWRNMQIKYMKPWNTCLLRTMHSIMIGVFEGSLRNTFEHIEVQCRRRVKDQCIRRSRQKIFSAIDTFLEYDNLSTIE